MPRPELSERIAILAFILLVSFFIIAIEPPTRQEIALRFVGSAFGVITLLPIPVAGVAMLIAWDVRYFIRGYVAAMVVVILAYIPAFIGWLTDENASYRLFDPAGSLVLGMITIAVWSITNLIRYFRRWKVGRTELANGKYWWGLFAFGVALTSVSYPSAVTHRAICDENDGHYGHFGAEAIRPCLPRSGGTELKRGANDYPLPY